MNQHLTWEILMLDWVLTEQILIPTEKNSKTTMKATESPDLPKLGRPTIPSVGEDTEQQKLSGGSINHKAFGTLFDHIF